MFFSVTNYCWVLSIFIYLPFGVIAFSVITLDVLIIRCYCLRHIDHLMLLPSTFGILTIWSLTYLTFMKLYDVIMVMMSVSPNLRKLLLGNFCLIYILSWVVGLLESEVLLPGIVVFAGNGLLKGS